MRGRSIPRRTSTRPPHYGSVGGGIRGSVCVSHPTVQPHAGSLQLALMTSSHALASTHVAHPFTCICTLDKLTLQMNSHSKYKVQNHGYLTGS